MPRLADVADDLAAFVADRDRAAALEERLASLDRTIHERVCSLYGVSDAERAVVAREFGGKNGF